MLIKRIKKTSRKTKIKIIKIAYTQVSRQTKLLNTIEKMWKDNLASAGSSAEPILKPAVAKQNRRKLQRTLTTRV